MHIKLGGLVPNNAWVKEARGGVDKRAIRQIQDFTKRNEHTEARKYIAQNIIKDDRLANIYYFLSKIDEEIGHMPRALLQFRDDMDQHLSSRLVQTLGHKEAERVWEAL